jgi:hypothetical protein
MIVGFSCGIAEGGIQFFAQGFGDVARAECNIHGDQLFQALMRSLGGMQLQANLAPDSISDELRAPLLRAELFPSLRGGFDDNESLLRLLDQHGFLGDWDLIDHYATNFSKRQSDRLELAQRAHVEVRELFLQRSHVAKGDLICDDITLWFDSDDPDIAISPLLFYPVTRAQAIWS